MLEKLLNNPHLLHQTPDDKDGLPEVPIAAYTDSTGLIVLSQEGRQIVVNRNSVAEMCKLLKQLAAEAVRG